MDNHAAENTLKKNSGKTVASFLLKNNCVVILIALIIISAIVSPHFLTITNIFNLVRQYSLYMFMAIGMLFVLISGGIDLAQGSCVGLCGIVASCAMCKWGWGANSVWGLIPAVLVTLIAGAVFGCISGALVSRAKMAPFIVTLAMQIAGQGVSYLLTKGTPIRILKDNAASNFLITLCSKGDPLFGFPFLGYLAIAIIVVFTLILRYTKFGRLTLATGSNPSAVRFAGISVSKYTFYPYLISGIMAACAGIILTGRAGSATVDGGQGYEFDVIAGCIIGGTSLNGGKGSVPHAVVGMITLALITNILNLLSVAAATQNIIKGLIIILAVLMSNIIEKRKQLSA